MPDISFAPGQVLASFAPGQVLAGRYRVERVLGQGGMGIVLAVRHLQLGTLSAMKFMLDAGAASAEMADRFLREARAAASLKGENIARVNDFGALESGTPYIVMEYLEGADLDEELRRRGRLPVREAIGYVRQANAAMMEAHAHGIVHRDLKPQNLFLTRRPDGTPLVKVLDFGISKLNDGGLSGLSATSSSAVIGSPLYMSPEQVKSARAVDARSDIYSLGVILFQLVSGRFPYLAESAGELFALILTAPPAPLLSLAPDLPPQLAAIVDRCLRKNRDERFATVAEFDAALASIETTVASLSQPFTGSPALAPHFSGQPAGSYSQPSSAQVAPTQLAPSGQHGGANSAPYALRPGLSSGAVSTFGGGASTLPSGATRPPKRTVPIVLGGVAALGVAAVVALVLIAAPFSKKKGADESKKVDPLPTVVVLRFHAPEILPPEGALVTLNGAELGTLTPTAPTTHLSLKSGDSLLTQRLVARFDSTCGPAESVLKLPFSTYEEMESKYPPVRGVATIDVSLGEGQLASIAFDNAGGKATTLAIGQRTWPIADGATGTVHVAIGSCLTARTVSIGGISVGDLETKRAEESFLVDVTGGHCYEGRSHAYSDSGTMLQDRKTVPVSVLKNARIYRTAMNADFLVPSPDTVSSKASTRDEILRCSPKTSSASVVSTPATGTATGAKKFGVGAPIEVEWQGKWWAAHVVSVPGPDQYRIHYDGWADSWDETVGPSRMRPRAK